MRVLSFGLRTIKSVTRPVLLDPISFNLIKTFKTKSHESSRKNLKLFKLFGGFAMGVGTYLLVNKYNSKPVKEPPADDPTLNLDLNEIYEKTAAIFLSNPELREVMGMPIKITSSNEIDQVRSLHLSREGKNVFAFIAYDLQGSINSGTVFCKLKMNSENKNFKTESIICKLSKPDSKKRTEFVIKSTSK